MHRDLYNKGNMFFDKGDFHSAIDAYKQALYYNPNHTSSKMNIGLCYNELGEFKIGESWLRECLSINPQDYKGLFNLGRCIERQEKLEEGQIYFKKDLEVNPHYETARIALGCNYFKLGLFGQGERELLKLIEHGKKALAYYGLAYEFYECRNIPKAQYYRDKYFEICPEKRGETLTNIP
jgi:protein O-GlcNAc transferase